jgi:predicted ATPase
MSSATSLASRNVRQEIALAWKYGKSYLPLLLDTAPVPKEIEYWLETAQWIEALDHPREAWLPKVVAALGHLGAPADPSSTPARQPVDRSTPQPPAVISIPTPLTALVGRQIEIGDIASLVRLARLVTLTGAGGTGKTRLAIAVCHEATGEFPDGVAFVSLAAVRDPGLVILTVATALGVREAADEPILTTLARVIGERRLLLALDNLEQVIDAAADISALLAACPRLHVLATSRTPLHLSGEREYLVPPLAIPEAGAVTDVQLLTDNASVALFLDRAQAVRRDFTLTRENAGSVAAICRQLDGLPLALELAAARVKLMTPQAILTRLEQPLAVLTGGARDLPERQQTIRATIQWSHDLLSTAEQRLFRRLSVFVGGSTLDAAEAVATADDDPGIDVVDGVLSLIEKSLMTQVEQPDGETRFGMSTTVREFGLEQLAASADAAPAQDALAAYFLRLAEDADLESESGSDFVLWLDRLERELDNLRAALAWANERDADMAFRLVFGMWHLWYTRGHLTDGRRLLHLILDRWPAAPVMYRAKALDQAGSLASWQGDVARATTLHEESLRLYQEMDDQRGISQALFGLGRAAQFAGDLVAARDLYEQSIALARTLDHRRVMADATGNLALVFCKFGDFERALELNGEALAIERGRGSLLGVLIGTTDRAEIMIARGDNQQAKRLYLESLRLGQQIGMLREVGDCIAMLAMLAGASGDPERAARLIGVSQRLQLSLNYFLLPIMGSRFEQSVSGLRAELGSERFDTLVAEGAAMSMNDAIALALRDADGSNGQQGLEND